MTKKKSAAVDPAASTPETPKGEVTRAEFEEVKRRVEALDHHAGHPLHPDDEAQPGKKSPAKS